MTYAEIAAARNEFNAAMRAKYGPMFRGQLNDEERAERDRLSLLSDPVSEDKARAAIAAATAGKAR